ncbi:MAG: LuxR C-terminal-related transcriptional regulator [Desulfovermiculus sp.]
MCQKIQDISKDRRALQSSLADSLKLATVLFPSPSTPILFMDSQFTIIMANSSWNWLLGWKEGELVGRAISRIFPEDQFQDFYNLNQCLQQDEQYWQGEFLIQKSNESSITVQITTQRVELLDQTIYVLYLDKVLADIQESKKAEAAQGGIYGAETLIRALQSLEQAHSRYQLELAHQIEVSLLPTLKKMSYEPDSQIRRSYQTVLSNELASLLNELPLEGDQDLLKLTPTEMEVCKYIQSGLSSKEIAELKHSSFDTIQTHRKNIRKKMGLNGQKTPLCTFLRVKKRLPSIHAQV